MRINRRTAVRCALIVIPLGILGLFAILLYSSRIVKKKPYLFSVESGV